MTGESKVVKVYCSEDDTLMRFVNTIGCIERLGADYLKMMFQCPKCKKVIVEEVRDVRKRIETDSE